MLIKHKNITTTINIWVNICGLDQNYYRVNRTCINEVTNISQTAGNYFPFYNLIWNMCYNLYRIRI